MSLDIYLRARRMVDIFEANITHNLSDMAAAAGIYLEIWCPEELGIKKAEELILPLEKGLERLIARPQFFKKYNPPNGWGNYEGLVDFVKKYLEACKKNPNAKVKACG